MELSLLTDKESSFDWAPNAVNKELSAAEVECVALRRTRDEVLTRLKILETDLRNHLKIVSERTTEKFLSCRKSS